MESFIFKFYAFFIVCLLLFLNFNVFFLFEFFTEL